jgi:dipeptidyl aminopeptidase/acylaminoacyl peptidase
VVGGDGPLEEFCPERLVTQAFPPTLLFHGESDTDVPLEQSLSMATALDVAGVPHRLRIVPGASHSFDRAGDAAARDALAETVAFLRESFSTGGEGGTQAR